MRTDDAEKVISILLMADGECPHCASNLIDIFCKEYPEWETIARRKYARRFH